MYIGNWQWIDFGSAPSPVDWLAFILGGTGILFTIAQLLRSKGALKAARNELERTRAMLIKNQLVAVLPGFEELMTNLDRSIRHDDRLQLEDHLHRFAYHAYEAAALLTESSPEYHEIAQEVIEGGNFAMEAKSLLYGSPGVIAEELLGQKADQLRQLVLRLHGLAVSIRNDPGSTQNKKKGA